MASSNLEIDVKREEKLISTKENNSLYDDQILLPASRPIIFENVGTLIMGDSMNAETIKNNEPNPINWDELTHTEDWQIVERRVIEELQHAQPGTSSVEDIIGALKALMTISGDNDSPKQYIISLVLDTLPIYPQNVNVQIWGLQALHCLNKRLQPFEIYVETRQEILRETYRASSRFKNDVKLQQMVLKIMTDLCGCLDPSPLSQTDFQWWSSVIAMRSLCNFDDESIHQTALKYLSKLLQVLPTRIESIASNKQFRERLYQILVEKYKAQTSDDGLKIVLDLWKEITYSTDYRNCFILESKLHILVQLLELFVASDPIIVEKVLAILEQVGRHTNAYDGIMTKDLIMQLLNLVGNEHLPISFLSATVLVNHLSNKSVVEKFDEELLRKIYRVIKSAVYKWDSTHESEVIKLESLKPLMNILLLSRETALKLYAAWTINHLSVQNPKFYAARLFEEKLMDSLESFKNQSVGECPEIELHVKSALANIHNAKGDQSSSRRNVPKFSLGQIALIIKNETEYAVEAQQLKSEAIQIGEENSARIFPQRSGFGKILCDYFEENSTTSHPSSEVRKIMKAVYHTANVAESFVKEFNQEQTIHNALGVIHGFAESLHVHQNPHIISQLPLVLSWVNNLFDDLGSKNN